MRGSSAAQPAGEAPRRQVRPLPNPGAVARNNSTMPPRRVRLATSFAGEMRPFIAPPTPQGAQTPHPLVGDDVRILHCFGGDVRDSSHRHLRSGPSPTRPACSPLPACPGKDAGERQRSLGGNVSANTSRPVSLTPALSRWERGPIRPRSGFPGILRHCQLSSRRHGRLPPDLPCCVSLRGLASPDVRDGTSLGGGSLSDIQRRSAELGIALPDVPPAVRHFTAALPHLRQSVRHFGDTVPRIRQLIRHFTDVLLFIRQSIRHFGDAVLWLFDHFPQLSVSVR